MKVHTALMDDNFNEIDSVMARLVKTMIQREGRNRTERLAQEEIHNQIFGICMRIRETEMECLEIEGVMNYK